jgi:hypothetical protein
MHLLCWWCGAEHITQYDRSRATLDATGRRNRASISPISPRGCHGHQFWRKKSSCGIVKSLYEACVQKAPNGPSSQLIEATSCVKRSNTTINSLTAKSCYGGEKHRNPVGFYSRNSTESSRTITNITTMVVPFAPHTAWDLWIRPIRCA